MRVGPHDGISALRRIRKRNKDQSSSSFSATWGHREKMAMWQSGKRALPRNSICQHLTLDFPASRTARNKCVLLKPVSLWYFVSAVRAKTWPDAKLAKHWGRKNMTRPRHQYKSCAGSSPAPIYGTAGANHSGRFYVWLRIVPRRYARHSGRETVTKWPEHFPRLIAMPQIGFLCWMGGGIRWSSRPIHIHGRDSGTMLLPPSQWFSSDFHGKDWSDADKLLDRNVSIRVLNILQFPWMPLRLPVGGGEWVRTALFPCYYSTSPGCQALRARATLNHLIRLVFSSIRVWDLSQKAGTS